MRVSNGCKTLSQAINKLLEKKMSCTDCPNLIVTGEYSTKKFECSYFKPHGVPLKSAALEAKVLIKGKPHLCDYKHTEVQNEAK